MSSADAEPVRCSRLNTSDMKADSCNPQTLGCIHVQSRNQRRMDNIEMIKNKILEIHHVISRSGACPRL